MPVPAASPCPAGVDRRVDVDERRVDLRRDRVGVPRAPVVAGCRVPDAEAVAVRPPLTATRRWRELELSCTAALMIAPTAPEASTSTTTAIVATMRRAADRRARRSRRRASTCRRSRSSRRRPLSPSRAHHQRADAQPGRGGSGRRCHGPGAAARSGLRRSRAQAGGRSRGADPRGVSRRAAGATRAGPLAGFQRGGSAGAWRRAWLSRTRPAGGCDAVFPGSSVIDHRLGGEGSSGSSVACNLVSTLRGP